MYENYVCPIMDYGSEVWSHQPKDRNKVDNAMVIQHRAEHYYCGVGQFTPTNGYNLDMNWTPVGVQWKINTLRLWNKLTTCNKERMLYKVFNNDYNMCADKSGWCSWVKEILSSIDDENSYDNKIQVDIRYTHEKLCKNYFDDIIEDAIANKPKLQMYVKIKDNGLTEKSMSTHINRLQRSLMLKFQYGVTTKNQNRKIHQHPIRKMLMYPL